MDTKSLQDDPSIPNEEVLYRRISSDSPNLIATDAVTGEKRPSSGSFKPDKDGLSVYRKTILQESKLELEDITTSTSNIIVSIKVADVRNLPPLGVVNDPCPQGIKDEGHPRNKAHALIVGWQGLTPRERKQRQRELTRQVTFVYPL